MELFLEKKKPIIDATVAVLDDTVISDSKLHDKVDELAIIYNDLIHDTWKRLMRLEIELFEQMEDVNQTFEHTLNDMVNTFIEEAQGVFSQIRALENTYMENISDSASRIMTNMNIEESFLVPEPLQNVNL